MRHLLTGRRVRLCEEWTDGDITVERYSTSEVEDLAGIGVDWFTGGGGGGGVGRTGDVEIG